jgi:hypothetical protein
MQISVGSPGTIARRNGCQLALVLERRHMPRYFFNVRNHVDAKDLSGRELPSLEAAVAEAHADIADIKRARFETIGGWTRWSIEICDDKRLLLKVVPFSPH